MRYPENIEPIHSIEPEVLDHLFEILTEDVRALYTTKNEPETSQSYIEEQIDCNLKALEIAIKKSLSYFYPSEEKTLIDVVDEHEADHFRHDSIVIRGYIDPLLDGGADALSKIFRLSEYMEHYNGWTAISFEIKDIELSIKNFVQIAYEGKMREMTPFVNPGKKYLQQKEKAKEYGRQGGKAETYSKDILESVISNLKQKSFTAKNLWNHYRIKHNGEEAADEFGVYFNEDYTGLGIDELFDADGRPIKFDTFRGYVTRARKEIKKIVAQ